MLGKDFLTLKQFEHAEIFIRKNTASAIAILNARASIDGSYSVHARHVRCIPYSSPAAKTGDFLNEGYSRRMPCLS